MRRMLVLALFLFAACASRDGYVSNSRDCSAGGDLSVDMFLNIPQVMMEGTQDNLVMVVAIGNNSTHDVEVKSIRVEPGYTAQQRYALENSFREFNKVLAPGDDYQFELPVRGAAGRREVSGDRRGGDAIEVVLAVYLADGTIYRCTYDIQAPK